jgi:hypothetical protein
MTKRMVPVSRFAIAGSLLVGSLIAGWILLSSGHAGAQEKHRYFFKTPEGVAKYTQQHVIDVGDLPGHQVRVFELHTKYAGDAPAYDGVKVAEIWTRGMSDYTNGSGHAQQYSVNVLENGDKIFTRGEVLISTAIAADGSRTSKVTNIVTLTGGTGKYKGIRGTLRASALTDFKTGTSNTVTEGEYWFEK